ncbi:YeeE/YedE thiosulfate transporter family protein [Achromobacter xylosoxidans]
MSTHPDAAAAAFRHDTERARAVRDFIAQVKALVPDPARATPEQLAPVARLLEALGRRAELFPAEAFAVVPGRPTSIYRLAEDADGGYALYLSLGEPGKAQPPHDHTTWAIIAGVSGNERNEVYARSAGNEPGRDVLTHVRRVDVAAGNSIVLGPADVHTIELVGDAPGAHLHFYGLALDRLHGRVVFESTAGGAYRTFSPPAAIYHARLSPAGLQEALRGEAEIAVLDVREAGCYARRHLLYAVPAPLWRLEVLADRLVPRRDTRIVLVDDDETLAHQAAAKLTRLGWTDISVLAGGTDGWEREGRELFSGTNVPSKAFGEVIEHEKHTPWIDVDDLHERVARGDDIVVVDSRTPEEFHNFTLPFSHSLPGAELVYRIRELAPDPKTFVVVNCAGRTRSIVGAQTLIDAGIPNRVASLRNGTMEWLLSGRELAYGRQPALPEPSADSAARTAASAVGALPTRLEGLDTFAGCATAVKQALLSNNGAFVLALVAGAWAAALAAGAFRPRRPTVREILRNFIGGILMGWGGMTALGCTVGTLLSGVMAGAASGWIFGAACVAGIWAALKLRPTRPTLSQ